MVSTSAQVSAGAADEIELLQMLVLVAPSTALAARGLRQQCDLFVIAHDFDLATCALGKLSNGEQ